MTKKCSLNDLIRPKEVGFGFFSKFRCWRGVGRLLVVVGGKAMAGGGLLVNELGLERDKSVRIS